ncbi:MAG: two-component system, OmpR family, sensor kinase [Solirubrobacteraceae bacterium]|jgi:signal transduction histidine kinase|nr:two-component system, OmpR family, sensor kinase [Solirubrobacteraceae bacterium]
MAEEDLPIASAAAFTPSAAPLKKFESKILTLDDDFGKAFTNRDPAPEPESAPVVQVAPAIDRLAVLRDLARKLRAAPDSEETLQTVIDEACRCTRSDAAVLTLSAPISRQFVCGTALGAGPYINVPLRAGGPSFGELVLTRLAEGADYEPEDETFGELIAEYVAKAVSTLRSGTVISQEEQDFIDRVTEDLRAPLAGAVGTIGLAMAEEGMGDDSRTYLKAAHGDLRRMLNTVDNLLTLAHLRPPKPSDLETVPVNAWLQRAVEENRQAAADRELTVTLREPPEAYLISGVPAQLDLLLGQLVANAVKFTDPGGRVDITAGLAEGMVKVSVHDNGIGFDSGDAGRMTDCFTRAITAEAGRYPGLGLGLFLANQIATNHGGRLWLESRRDEGTQAHVAIPQRLDVV